MSRESFESNLDYPAEFREKSSSSSPSRLSSFKTSSFKITSNKRTNHDVLDNQKKYLTSPENSTISLRSEPNTEDGSPVIHERPRSILTLNPLTTKPVSQKQDDKPVTNVASPKKKTQAFRPKECKWYSNSNYKYGDYKECTNYIRYGYCRFGAKCRYEHPDVDQFSFVSEASTEAADLELSNNDLTLASKKRINKRGPCWFFKRTGSCFKGDSCEFAHITKVSQSIQEKLNKKHPNFEEGKPRGQDNTSIEEDKICRNFSHYGRCRFGNSCKFSHLPTALSDTEINRVQETTLKKPETFSIENSKLFEFVAAKDSSINVNDKKKKEEFGNVITVRNNFIRPTKPSLYIADLSDEDLKNLW